jgi:tRNA pseudouridine55 synthase
MNGFLNILKPPKISSFDVIRFLRKFLPPKTKAGYFGTLDPAATGVLVVGIGGATKYFSYLDSRKRYRFEVLLGYSTDTLDVDGKVLVNRVDELPIYTEEEVKTALLKFTGKFLQVPPLVSAKRKGGVRLYKLARKGVKVEPDPKLVHIYSLELVHLTDSKPQRLLLDAFCSSGTYMRSLARDLGEELGAPAILSFLVRTQSGEFHISKSVTLEQIAKEGVEPFLSFVEVKKEGSE